MIFYILLILAAVCGGCLGALLSHTPGKRSGTVLTGLLLAPISLGLFLGGLFLWARSRDLAAVFNRFFPDRLSKLAGCGLLLGLGCGLGLLAGILRAKGPRAYFRRISGSRLHRGVGLAVLGGGLLLAIGCAVLAGDPAPTPVRLSEVCCANFTLWADPDTGEYSDYIELVNTGSEAVDLGGYFLSDKAKKRSRFRLPALVLEPGECVVLWADGAGKSGTRTGTDIHLNFSLKPGDTVWFSSPHGILLDQVTVPERYKNISLSLLEGEWVLARGTPCRTNDGAALFAAPSLEAPVLSLASGFYAEPQTLEITAPAGCEVRYTLDGSVPTAASPLWEGPLTLTDISDQPNRVVSQPNTTPDRSGAITEPVDKGTVIRAACFDGTGAYSETVTGVWFIGETFAKYAGKAVLSLVVDPADLFGTYGIAVTGPAYDAWLEAGGEGSAPTPNYQQHGRNWERDAELLLWDESGAPLLETPCGVRLQGNSNRARSPKRFSLYARPLYGTGSLFEVPVFSDVLSHSFMTRPNVHEVMAQALIADLGLGGQKTRPATVFINGELYESSFLRERYDARYFETQFGVDRDDLVTVTDGKLDIGRAEDLADYVSVFEMIQAGDCSDPDFYAEVCRRIDPENYAVYVAANLYLNNTDWSTNKNYRLWRSRSGSGDGVLDGRWRWLAYDMDSCYWNRSYFEGTPRASYDIFPYRTAIHEVTFLEMSPFCDLLESPAFRDLFARTWLELMNTTLSYEMALPYLEQYGLTEDAFWPEFLRDRPAYAVDQLIAHIVPEGRACGLTVTRSDPAGGTVRIGSAAPVFRDGTWTGTWVTGVTLELTAEPTEGWRFLRWEGGAEGAEAAITLSPAGDVELVAVFEPAGNGE